MLGLLGAEGKRVLSRLRAGQVQTQTLRPACSWSPALAQDQLLWDPVEGRYASEDVVWCLAGGKRAEDEEGGC